MANETLDSSTVVVNLDIPQTLQETILTTTEVVNKDIPQTLQETNLSVTAVVGQVGEKVQTGLVTTGLVIGKSLNGVFNNFGIIKIIVPNSQITI